MAVKGNAPISVLVGIGGWDTYGEQLGLIALSALLPKKATILEIGTEHGQSLACFLTGSPDANIYSLDINPDIHAPSNLHHLDFDLSRVTFIAENSQTTDWRPPLLDLLFVDGDHTYGGALNDLVKFTPYVRQYGYLAIHDCACSTNKHPHESHHAVLTAVRHWKANATSDWTLITTIDTLMIYRREDAPNENDLQYANVRASTTGHNKQH